MLKRTMVLLVLMVSLMVPSFAFNGPLKRHPTNPHWFTDNSGKAIYLTGCWTWNNVQDYEGTLDFNSYLNFLEANGQNYFKFRVWEHIDINPPLFKPTGTTGNAWNGGAKFDVTQVNPAYLQRLRDRCIAAGQKGIYCQISLFQWREEAGVKTTNGVFFFRRNALHAQNNINGINGDTNGDGDGPEIEIETNSATTNIQKGYLRQLIDYLNDLDNIFYETAIEGPTTGLAWRNEMINYIHSYESTKPKQHLVNISPTQIAYSYSLSAAQMEFMLSGPAEIVSPSLEMGYDSNPPVNTRKIMLNDDDHYWWQDAGGVPSWVGPQWVWRNFLRGVHTTLLDTLPTNVIGGFANTGNPSYTLHGGDSAIYVAMRKNMGYAISYSKKMNLGNMLPRNDLASSGYCLAGGGEYLALCSPYSNSVTVNLQGTAGTLNVEWLNPSNGQVISGGTVTGGASRSFTAPFSNGWPYDQCQAVLYISGAGTADTTPPTTPVQVRDGLGTDASSTYSTTQLSANWDASTDAESGIIGYKYAIGTTAGGTNVAGWTTIGNVLTVTKTGLTLTIGTTYYFMVKAVNGASPALESTARNSNGQVVLLKTQELVGHWKLDETSGSGAADSSGKGNAGTLTGSPVWAPAGGKIGGSLGFDGTDDYVNYGANGILDFPSGDGFTIAGWVKTTESYGPIISQRNSAMNGGAVIDIVVGYDGTIADAGKLMALVRQDSGGSGYARVTGGAVNNGAWRHFALKRNTNGSIELFLDGVSQGTNSGSESGGAITTDLRSIGSERKWVQDSQGTADQRYLNGAVDDVRVYNYALSAVEIQALSNVSDTTPPSAPGTVRDGTGTTDMGSTTLTTQLSANWTASADAESGISGYNYAIGSSPAGTNVAGWTALGNVLTATKTGLNLSVGATYYFSVKAINGAGLTGTAANSNGQVVLSTAVADTTPPSVPGTVRDGPTAGTDAGFTYSTTTLSANWTASADGESGIAGYRYAIGTTAGATNITNWASLGNVLTITKTGLTLTVGTTYYFSVKATNGAGLTGAAANSNGQYVNELNTADTTPPSVIAQVRDGAETGTDAGVIYLTDELSANWTDSSDAESGISRYLYAIGTSPGATDITNWKDNGELTEVTETGLTLAVGTTYYFSVKAENGVGLQSAVTNSNGQLVLSQDNQGPLISNVSAQGITNSGVTITWETDEPSTSRVEYGITAGYGSLTGEYLSMNTVHSVTLTGLLGATQYHFRVISRDYAGNESISVDFTFTTLSTLNTEHSSKAYPNPHDFSNGAMTFKFIENTGGEVRIYTVSGKLARKLTAQSNVNEISWDGRNEDNEEVARGIYIYQIINNNGDKITGKLAITR